jgi:hypothetical protein
MHTERTMERLTITIRPGPSEEGLLRVADAMQQVLDLVKLHEEAERAMAAPEQAYEWRLERASTASPFTVVAIADPVDPNVDVSGHVREVKSAVAIGIRNLIRGEAPWWMGPDAMNVARSVFSRTQNGVSVTRIEYGPNEFISIDRVQAAAGIRAIGAINALSLEAEIGEREAFGEIPGVMVAAGRYRNRPAIQLKADLYGFVWCQLSEKILERFGSEHAMREVWEGKTLGITGKLIYAVGGAKLSRIEVTDIREIRGSPPIDLGSVLDPNFTAGLDPVEYLRQLHEGELA